MSIVKLAATPVLVINHQDTSGNSKRGIAAAAVGGTTGFAANEAIEHLPKFDKTKALHRYGRRMGSVLGGFAGAAGVYHYMNKKKQNQDPQFYML